MRFDVPAQRSDGSWSVGIHEAYARELLRVFDPEVPYVVVEGHDPAGSGWHTLKIPLNADGASAATRRVRAVRFDLLLSPQQAVAAADELDTGFPNGWLYAWQVEAEPPADLRLLQKDERARLAAMLGVGVTLLIDLPHAGETSVLWSPARPLLEAGLDRLR